MSIKPSSGNMDKENPARRSPWKLLHVDPDGDLPMTVQLADQLIWLVASGQVSSGEKLPTIRTLAKDLGINLHTVRAAYKRLESAGLIVTRRGIGSLVCEPVPHQFEGRRSGFPAHVVGLVVPDLGGPFYSAILSGIQSVARQHQFFVIASATSENAQAALDQLDMLIAKGVDGVMVASDYLPAPLGTEGIPGPGASDLVLPVVHIDRPDHAGYSITFDAAGMGYMAAQHLVEHGYRSVGLITPPRQFPTYRDCYTGFSRALAENGLEASRQPFVEAEGFAYAAGYKAAISLLDEKDPPEAIFVAEDSMAIGTLKAIRERGLRIPEDIALVGANNFEIADYVDPGLTTVYTSAKELGVAAMEMTVQLIAGDVVRQPRVVLPTRLVVRQSCGCTDVSEHHRTAGVAASNPGSELSEQDPAVQLGSGGIDA